MFKILIIDDDPMVRAALKRTLQNEGYDTTTASNGSSAITQAQRLRPAVIICDWMMPQVNGLEVCRQIKADPELATSFFILLTAKGAVPGEEEDRVRGLDAGADEFVSKPIVMNELKARVRAGLRLHQLNHDLQTQKQALETLNQNLQSQKQILEAELVEAGSYVRSLLPKPLVGTVTTESLFVPSAQLGGDCFDYYWLDDDNLAMYLLDVSGHGVGSALLSVSVLNVLRSQSLPSTNFCQPSQVLRALNHAFQMIEHGERYFTIWYGVYNQSAHQLVYASAGHPPAVLLAGTSAGEIQVRQLGVPGLPLGILPDDDFDDNYCTILPSSNLYIFSDGAYEIHRPDGTLWGLEAFIQILIDFQQTYTEHLDCVFQQISTETQDIFKDDLSLLKVTFS